MHPTPARPPCTPSRRWPMMTQRDPWVNMLRTTVAAFAAGVGGADTVRVHTVRRRDSRRIARRRNQLSHAASPATPSCCCSRSPTSAGCSTRRAARGSSRISPRGLAEQAWTHFRRSRPTAASPRPATTSPNRSPRSATVGAATSRTAAPRSPGSTSTRTSTEAPLPHRESRVAGGAVRRGFEALRDRSDAYLAAHGCPAHGHCCCRWVRSPNTTSAPRSPPTCWPPAASRPSTRAPSMPPVWPARSARGRRRASR